MLVQSQIPINAAKAAVWAAITDIDHAAEFISGILKIEILEKPSSGIIGLKWSETRILFGKPTDVVMWITEAAEYEFYKTQAEDGGFVFITTIRISDNGGGVTLTESHESKPQTFKAKLQMPMLFLFKGVIRKAIMQDLKDIKEAVEKGGARAD